MSKAGWLLFLSFVIVFTIQSKMINNTLPYSVNIDEDHFLGAPLSMMKTGDFNPHFFNYPTLPLYLTTIGTTIGFFKSASSLETKNLKDLSPRIYPYFKHPIIIKYPKLLFIVLSSSIFVFLILIIKILYPQENQHYVLIPILFVSSVYMEQSWSYLNVNIVGAFFIVSTLLYLFLNKEKDTFLTKTVFPGILIGAAIASKYNFFLLMVPVILSIYMHSTNNKLFKALMVLPISIITFIVFVPYSLLDFPKFLSDVAFELWHYKAGHAGHNGTPGFSQFIYYIHSIIEQFTYPLFFLGIIGLIKVIKDKPKDFFLLISFPILMLIFMSAQKVNFLRNVISIYAIYSIFISLGLYSTIFFIKHLKEKKIRTFSYLILALALVYPMVKITHNLKRLYIPDSRNYAINWIEKHIQKGLTIYIANDLYLDARKISKKYTIKRYKRTGIDDIKLNQNEYIIVPIYGYDHRKASGKTIADKLNREFEIKNFKKLRNFGTKKVLANYSFTVPSGDPEMYIGSLSKKNQ